MNRLAWRQAAFSLLAVGAFAVSGCDDSINGVGSNDFIASEEFSFNVDGAGKTRFTLAGINGNVVITGVAAADSFVIEGERRVGSETQADADAHLPELQVIVTDTGAVVGVRTDQPSNTGGRNYTVNYEIQVPAGVETIVGNVNGNVTIVGIQNDVLTGSTNGNINLAVITGDVEVGNVNGNVDLDDIIGSVAAATVNGNVSGDVTLPQGGDIDLAAVNGNLFLSIPTSTSADVVAALDNGTISTLGLTFSNLVETPTRLTGTLGAGDGDIALATVNGNISMVGI